MSDVIVLYAEEVVPQLATAKKALARLDRLTDWWGDMMLDEVTGSTCRKFAETKTAGAARRELQDLQAAINYHHEEGLHREEVKVSLPPAGDSRDRWLTRSEIAKLLWVCWRTREVQEDGPTNKRPLRHLARFILFSVYTGSRPGDVLRASFFAASNRGFVDLETGLYFRKPREKSETNKRQPTIRLPHHLLAHMRRWRAGGALNVVEFGNEPIGSIKTGFAHALDLTKLPGDVVPYTLRHTAATWMLQDGVPTWEVAGYLGTSEQMIEAHYGHHNPDHLSRAVGSMEGSRRRSLRYAQKPPEQIVKLRHVSE